MAILLVRHAWAGKSDQWAGDDAERPLDTRGREQAALLVEQLAEFDVRRVVTSPTERCRATVEPLAAARGLAVEERDELGEDASPEDTLALLRDAADGTVACTHGEVIARFLGEKTKKGTTSIVEVGAGGLERLWKLPPPT